MFPAVRPWICESRVCLGQWFLIRGAQSHSRWCLDDRGGMTQVWGQQNQNIDINYHTHTTLTHWGSGMCVFSSFCTKLIKGNILNMHTVLAASTKLCTPAVQTCLWGAASHKKVTIKGAKHIFYFLFYFFFLPTQGIMSGFTRCRCCCLPPSCLFLLFMKLQVPAGVKEPRPPKSSPTYIHTPSHSQLLAEMIQSHMVKDICLIGPKVANTWYTYTHTMHIVNLILITNTFFYF